MTSLRVFAGMLDPMREVKIWKMIRLRPSRVCGSGGMGDREVNARTSAAETKQIIRNF